MQSKRPGTALPKATKGAKGIASRPTTAHPTAKKESALTPDVLLPAPIKEMIARPKSALPKPKPKPKPKVKIWKYGYFVTVESVKRELDSKHSHLNYLEQTQKPTETKNKFGVVTTRKLPVNRVTKKEEKKTKLKEEDSKEEQKMVLFSNNSKIAEENIGAVNPVFYNEITAKFYKNKIEFISHQYWQ